VNFLGNGFAVVLFSMFFTTGCLATRDWVQSWGNEQLFPVNKRLSETEAGMNQMGGRVSNVETRVQQMANQIADIDSRLSQTTAKADRALENLQRMKLDRKLVLSLKQGAFFESNSTVLRPQAKTEIDSFLSDVRGDSGDMSRLFFVVEGHTDNAGGQSYNYALARIRADNAVSYLTAQKKIDPSQVAVISYGESVPVADNTTDAGRAKNRRVEILVYKENIVVGSSGTPAPGR
jgi:outer membrane protein OmpA-like peptidoglycan-associated protein